MLTQSPTAICGFISSSYLQLQLKSLQEHGASQSGVVSMGCCGSLVGSESSTRSGVRLVGLETILAANSGVQLPVACNHRRDGMRIVP